MDEGMFVANEYVGPSRFQWSDKQLEESNRLLDMIPREYSRRLSDARIKEKVHRPGRLSMFINDPSESAESASIEGAIANLFTILERREYGGTLLQLVFKDIAHNFINNCNQTKELLSQIFNIEDGMLERGELKSGFVFFVCKNK